ncbi:1,4-alpha-glucan branching enzyme [Pyrobaculum oguniense TE7]|uniref:1,4-alpha-glucan branching enzyme n=1 Tax=Pyrobaculum oguniense (strain DSM 13380 / JCM 10595 / TE7) TaxID=698757 RepID=H6QCN6_PYROT|nr:1,4-alpha-glucan branching enzyme [Pyrobaculum oguniense TE7]
MSVKVLSKGVFEMENDQGLFTAWIEKARPGIGATSSSTAEKGCRTRHPAISQRACTIQGVGGGFPQEDGGRAGTNRKDLIIYEVHVGTLSPEGTFDGVIKKLDYLKELGVAAIEIMPIAQFLGGRDWGYNGVYLCAVQNTYGVPPGLWESSKRGAYEGFRRDTGLQPRGI